MHNEWACMSFGLSDCRLGCVLVGSFISKFVIYWNYVSVWYSIVSDCVSIDREIKKSVSVSNCLLIDGHFNFCIFHIFCIYPMLFEEVYINLCVYIYIYIYMYLFFSEKKKQLQLVQQVFVKGPECTQKTRRWSQFDTIPRNLHHMDQGKLDTQVDIYISVYI